MVTKFVLIAVFLAVTVIARPNSDDEKSDKKHRKIAMKCAKDLNIEKGDFKFDCEEEKCQKWTECILREVGVMDHDNKEDYRIKDNWEPVDPEKVDMKAFKECKEEADKEENNNKKACVLVICYKNKVHKDE